ncbi:nucleotidyltransferase family protein [Paenibacillus sp. NEAU-GSW1]|uniref:nucleotidyltransferase family protein n=1 Tax=Paenibacillus sp. NEAU-GSW1 TaxID=2682486 RepID=UPI0012E1CAFE|nr:nucleotidyltransferase family protein [Paenibacillus sp. NEAU-GSW1]MUT64718.1 hypothetical protein [Paenibacillus sp. NEAU-GSW1]
MDNDRHQLILIMERSEFLRETLHRSKALELGTYFVGAGCITQTVWNHLTGRPLTYGISDIDLVYFDAANLSFEEEDKWIKKASLSFNDIPFPVDVKNQARVHLWYESKFGIKLNPYRSLEEAISTWPTTATALGARVEQNGDYRIYAPFGLEDLFTLTLRPNKKLITEDVYDQKVEKWRSKWPELKVIEW